MKYNQKVVDLLKESIDEFSEAYAYSGRGMYGITCLGFDISINSSVFSIIVGIIAHFVEISNTSDIIENINDLVSIFENCEQDDMGMGSVIYFPFIEWRWGE